MTAARRAFPGFAAFTPAERADLLEAIVAEYDARADALVDAMITEMGAPEDFARKCAVEDGARTL